MVGPLDQVDQFGLIQRFRTLLASRCQRLGILEPTLKRQDLGSSCRNSELVRGAYLKLHSVSHLSFAPGSFRVSYHRLLSCFLFSLLLAAVLPWPASARRQSVDEKGIAPLGQRSRAVSVQSVLTDNPIDDTETFVRQHYADFLSREPDEEGLAFWIDNIDSCGEDAACREVKRIDTSAAYFLSIEFQETGYFVHRFYKASFGRRPLLAEFLADKQMIGDGVVVNSPGWTELLEENKQEFVDNWIARPAFTSIYESLNNAEYVDTLIANSGATFTETDHDAYVDVLNSGALTRAQVLRLIAENEAFFNSEYNAAFVEMQYFGYLRRNPQDPPNTDLSGFNFWLNKLNQFGGDFRRAEMVKAFLVSGEYRQRFGPP
jgi:hypothetical protein